jgi:hypothetical protein
MNSRLRRLFIGISLACLCLGKSSAQVVMTVDWSNLSAVKFTATSGFSAINYPGGTSWSFNEGIALLGFLTAPANVQDLGGQATSSSLTDSANTVTATSKFDYLASWNDAHTNYYPNNGNGSDLTLWNNSGATGMTFSTSSAAFHGEAVFDLSAYASFTNLFPALNATGNVGIWNGNGTLGTWQVVGAAAIPEPSTYAALVGLAALGLAVLRRRRAA